MKKENGRRPRTFRREILLAPALALMLTLLAACGSVKDGGQGSSAHGSSTQSGATAAKGPSTTSEKTVDSEADLSQLKVGPKENPNMLPAQGIQKAKSHPLPKNPPEGIKIYPATVSTSTKKDINYDNNPTVGPPSHGPHDPLWQNCGFYGNQIKARNAVHSLDHGSVWITYRPNLPKSQIETLKQYAREPYVLVSPYPQQKAPVVATSWRIQLPLKGANDPRLKQFVNEFRLSDIAPLSGNGCVFGVGNPSVKAPAKVYEKKS